MAWPLRIGFSFGLDEQEVEKWQESRSPDPQKSPEESKD
jgi:hypothetical protein